jgi:hypothetical protein
MRELIERDYEGLRIEQDLGLGMMLWLSHFFPQEAWAKVQADRSFTVLDRGAVLASVKWRPFPHLGGQRERHH